MKAIIKLQLLIILFLISKFAQGQDSIKNDRYLIFASGKITNNKVYGTNQELALVNSNLKLDRAFFSYEYSFLSLLGKNSYGISFSTYDNRKQQIGYEIGLNSLSLNLLYYRDVFVKNGLKFKMGSGLSFEELKINCDSIITPTNLNNKNSANLEKWFIMLPFYSSLSYDFRGKNSKIKPYAALRGLYAITSYQSDWFQNKKMVKRNFSQPNYYGISLDFGVIF